jgi:hypothetical protein
LSALYGPYRCYHGMVPYCLLTIIPALRIVAEREKIYLRFKPIQ